MRWAGPGQANQSSQCGRAGWDRALGVGVSQRPQAGEALGWRLSGASLPTGSRGDASTQAGPAPRPCPPNSPHTPQNPKAGLLGALGVCGGPWGGRPDLSQAGGLQGPPGPLTHPRASWTLLAASARGARGSLSRPSLSVCPQQELPPHALGELRPAPPSVLAGRSWGRCVGTVCGQRGSQQEARCSSWPHGLEREFQRPGLGRVGGHRCAPRAGPDSSHTQPAV